MTVTAAPLEPVRFVLECGTRYSMTVANVGLACCAIEFVAATMLDSADLRRTPAVHPAPDTEVLVVSGTVTDKLAPALRRMYDALPQPAYVMAFGACASSGGPYWDSYSVVQGVGQILPVDVYVPGCPPRPAALLDGLRTLQAAVAAGHPPGSVPREAALQDLRA